MDELELLAVVTLPRDDPSPEVDELVADDSVDVVAVGMATVGATVTGTFRNAGGARGP